MGRICSCLAAVCDAIGLAVMAVVSATGAAMQAIIYGIVACFDAIVSCLTCGRMGNRSTGRTTASWV
ncbi:hypothetical protein V1525DRAFT_410166 [Lipomyces kononenkoae]|uniref:Uncharacterized protein n=1 Tax=Lipomyces kononenkoae TaxID=34357 RepID=A0ACC3SUT2_LIPKO